MNDLELQALIVDLLRVFAILLFCWTLVKVERDDKS